MQIQKQTRGGARPHRWLQDTWSRICGPGLGDGLSAIPGDSRAGPLQGWWAQDPLPSGVSLSGVSLQSREPDLGSETGLGSAHLLEVQYGGHNLGTESSSANQAEGRCPPPSRAVGSFAGSEGPRPSCYRTKALRNPPPKVATAAKGHPGHSLEDGAHVLCSQAEHWMETLHSNGPPSPSPGPSGRSQVQSFPTASSSAACPCGGHDCDGHLLAEVIHLRVVV